MFLLCLLSWRARDLEAGKMCCSASPFQKKVQMFAAVGKQFSLQRGL